MTDKQAKLRKTGRRKKKKSSAPEDSIGIYRDIGKKFELSEADLKREHRNFLEICPDGFMSKNTFVELSRRVLGDKVKQNSDSLFRVFDADDNGCIDFEEYMLALRASSLHSREEKLKWIFDVFDKDRSGTICPDEIESLLGALFDISGHDTSEDVLEEACKDVMDSVDSNGDGQITKEEFVGNALKSETITGILR